MSSDQYTLTTLQGKVIYRLMLLYDHPAAL